MADFKLNYTGAQINENLRKASKAVLTESQDLSSSEQALARTNIDVPSSTDMSGALSRITELEENRASGITFKGSCSSSELAAKTGMSVGDTWYVTDNGYNETYNGTSWSRSSADSTPPGIANLYSVSSTYVVGNYVLHDNELYVCNTNITTPEAWNSSHWTSCKIADEVALKQNITDNTLTTTAKTIVGAINELDNNKADIDGYYETLSVGLADNLIDRKGDGTEQKFVYRTSCGTDSVEDDGSAEIKSLHGNTIVWNQLVDSATTDVTVTSGHKYRFYDKDGTDTIVTSSGGSFSVTGGDDMVFDLTAMFGSGNEPSTVAEFKKMFPLDYYAYNAGTLLSYNGTGIKTNGFNQLDSDGHIKVIANQTYHIEGTYTSLVDSDGNAVTVSNSEFTPTENDTYTMVGGSCVHLKWSGYRNGETEDYWTQTRSLPVSTYFPNGMRSAGSAYDELTKDKAITRIGAVDLGTLSWGYESSLKRFYSDLPNGADVAVSVPSHKCDLICQKYTNISPQTFDNNLTIDMTIRGSTDSSRSTRIFIRDLSYTDATTFETSLSGVYAYYKLTTPTETTISPPLNLDYKVADFGTEQSLPENTSSPTTSPMDAVIKYTDDFTRDLATLPKSYDTTAGLDALASALASALSSALDGTFTITRGAYDTSTKKYAWTCSFTANTEE